MTNRILIGDCRQVLPTLEAESVHCCVTSPPYFGLRDYGHADQIGLEKTPEQYIAELVVVFQEVRRVLRNDGTLWVNIGDTYSGGKIGRTDMDKAGRERLSKRGHMGYANKKIEGQKWRETPGLRAKQLIGIPWRLAFALQSDGWFLRQDIIWSKPNPMPESVTDRCTRAHEYIFLLSKSAKYFFDAKAIAEPIADSTYADKRLFNDEYVAPRRQRGYPGNPQQGSGLLKPRGETANKRSVWTVANQPYSGAHFASFPQRLIEPCILAGCPEGGIVLDPFGGSGTTAQVANANRRSAIIIELNPDYLKLQARRIEGNQIRIM